MMRKETLLVLIIFAISVVANYKFIVWSVTSLASGIVSLSVEEIVSGVIDSFSFLTVAPNFFQQNFTIDFRNLGNTNLTGNFSIEINHTILNTSVIINAGSFTVVMKNNTLINASFTPNVSGDYTARALINYRGLDTIDSDIRYSNASGSFSIIGDALINFELPYLVPLGEYENITAIFTSASPSQMVAYTEITVYILANGSLEEQSKYTSSPFIVNTSESKSFNISYLTNLIGLHYVKAVGYYEGKFVEVWSIFYVHYPLPKVFYVPPVAQIIVQPTPQISSAFNITYQDTIKLYRNDSYLFSIFIKNTGEAVLNNLRAYISTVNFVDVNINPKIISKVSLNSSTAFLISLYVPANAQLGTYYLDVLLFSDEFRESKRINLEILAGEPPEKEDLQNRISSYEIIISQLESEMFYASLDGQDIYQASQSLSNAKDHLQKAKDYLKLSKFEDTKRELSIVKKSLEDTALQLATSGLLLRAPALSPLILLPIIIAFLIGFLVYEREKKKPMKRPKLFREAAET